MSGGMSHAEALGVYIEELPHLLRAIFLRDIQTAREAIGILSMVWADAETARAVERRLNLAESRLGRKPLSLLDAARSPELRRRILEVRERAGHERDPG